jgi:hypothetical protein
MAQIPPGVVSATLCNLRTGEEQLLTIRANSACHFVDRFPFGPYEIQLRVDWTDLDARNDPMLDADFYPPGQSEPIKRMRRHPAHHTPKALDPRTKVWLYDFRFEELEMQLVFRVTRKLTYTFDGIIVDKGADV